MVLPKLTLYPIAHLFNQLLSLDPQSLDSLSQLSGKVVNITLEMPPFEQIFYIVFTAEGIQLQPSLDVPEDITLKGTPLALLNVWLQRNEKMPGQAVKITGDIHLLQSLQHIANQMDIDWEEPLAKVCGDTVAHQVGGFMRKIGDHLQRSRDTFTQNVSEYLQDEQHYLPPRLEINEFLNDVDGLRSDVERLEARMQRLAIHSIGDKS